MSTFLELFGVALAAVGAALTWSPSAALVVIGAWLAGSVMTK